MKPRRAGTRSQRPRPAPHQEPERVQKMLARAGVGSRREVEDWIRAGRLTINGHPAVLGARIAPADELRLDGRLVRQRAAPESGGRSFLCHRSPGESIGTSNERSAAAEAEEPAAVEPSGPVSRTPLLERLPRRSGRRYIVISPMPRIDGGLELVTADGALALRLQRAVRSLESEFSVRVLGELGPDRIEGLRGGLLDSGERLAVLECEASGGEGTNRWYRLRARGASGKSVRQLFERQGARVSRILRTRLGTLELTRALGRGHFREIEAGELEVLLAGAPTGANPA